jgi:hypothetical protein
VLGQGKARAVPLGTFWEKLHSRSITDWFTDYLKFFYIISDLFFRQNFRKGPRFSGLWVLLLESACRRSRRYKQLIRWAYTATMHAATGYSPRLAREFLAILVSVRNSASFAAWTELTNWWSCIWYWLGRMSSGTRGSNVNNFANRKHIFEPKYLAKVRASTSTWFPELRYRPNLKDL